MNGKDLLEGMSQIEERFVEEAETETLSNPIPFPWAKFASMAACFCLLLCSFMFLHPHVLNDTPFGDESTAPATVSNPAPETEWKSDQVIPASEPSHTPVSEVPSVILRVDRMTEYGFIGTVAELVDTDILDIGMELKVVYAEDSRIDIAMEYDSDYKSQARDHLADHTGKYVIVQFIHYDKETNTLTINLIEEKG